MVSSVSPETVPTPAKVLTVSRKSPATSLGGGGAWPDNKPTRHTQHRRHRRCGGRRRDRRARLRCPWAAADPGRAHQRHSTAGAVGVEGAGGTGGPGCGARGRWRGLAGLRDDAPSRRLAARTARGRAAAHGHTKQPGLTKHIRRPEHQRRHKQHHSQAYKNRHP